MICSYFILNTTASDPCIYRASGDVDDMLLAEEKKMKSSKLSPNVLILKIWGNFTIFLE